MVFRIPTGVRAWVEDVVVDEESRGQGGGRGLGREALNRASAAGARTVDLTSRPSRRRPTASTAGWASSTRDTNVYRWSG